MKEIGIETGDDLRQWTEADLTARFGKSGHYFYHIARGSMTDRYRVPANVNQ